MFIHVLSSVDILGLVETWTQSTEEDTQTGSVIGENRFRLYNKILYGVSGVYILLFKALLGKKEYYN